MDVFKQNIVVEKEHLDWNNHVNNITYIQWAVDLSREHWLSKVSDEIANNFIWVVRSHHIEYKKQSFLGDHLEIKTYVESVKGPLSERIVEIWKEGFLIAKVQSNWCFIDGGTQKIKRVPEEIKALFV